MLKKYLYHEEWNIAIAPFASFSNKMDNLQNICQDNQLYWLTKKYHFQADPFLIEKKGMLYVFYEALNHTWIKGHIRCRILQLNENLGFTELEDFALDDINQLNCHLSFPFLWQENDDIYLMPESHEAGQVCLFKATEFPKKWQKVATMVDGQKLIDSILLKDDKTYFLISSEHKSLQRKIYTASQLTHDWQPLNTNIKIDNVHRRLGGSIFYLKNQPYLICQETDHKEYGKSLFIKQLMRPNANDLEHGWQEQTIINITSQSKRYPDGIHTLNIGEKYIIMDAKRWQFQPFNFFVRKYRQLLILFHKLINYTIR